MPGMPPRPRWWHQLQAAKNEASLAVDLYNRSAIERSLEGFVVHMHLAWLYMLQARFLRDGVDFRYRKPNGHFERVNGDIKTWELARCLREELPDESSPVRRNVEFFIKLRNKIEHRYAALLSTAIAGKTQAHLLNFEEALVASFGAKEGMADDLRFPVFVSGLTPGAIEALKRVHKALPRKLTDFIREYDAAMPAQVQSDWRYDFRVLLLPQTGPKTQADAVMRFVREEEMTDVQRQARDVVQTVVRTKQVAVQNKGRHKPGAVAKLVQEGLGMKFTVSDHTKAWQHFKVRPPTKASRPENTDDRYCVWDEPHGDYLYTDAWAKRLIEELANPFAYKAVTGRRAARAAQPRARRGAQP